MRDTHVIDWGGKKDMKLAEKRGLFCIVGLYFSSMYVKNPFP